MQERHKEEGGRLEQRRDNVHEDVHIFFGGGSVITYTCPEAPPLTIMVLGPPGVGYNVIFSGFITFSVVTLF